MQDALIRAQLNKNWRDIGMTAEESVSHIKQAARMAKVRENKASKEDPNTRNK